MVFHPLVEEQIRRIVDLQIVRLKKRLEEKSLQLQISDGALDYLAEVGYDPVYGARPLKRAIQQSLENPLALDMLAGKFVPGHTIVVDKGNGQLVFSDKMTRKKTPVSD